MDQVYKLYDRQASSKICIKDYFQQYSELIKSSMCHEVGKSGEEKIFELMGTDLSQARILLIKHYCRYLILQYVINNTVFLNGNITSHMLMLILQHR